MKHLTKIRHDTAEIMAVLMALGAKGPAAKQYMEKHPRKNPLYGVDINAEYTRVQEKTSPLPRRKRDLVCFVVENQADIAKAVEQSAKAEAVEETSAPASV